MVYTSYEMIRDCRGNKPEGWSHFVTHYVPFIRRVIAHYFPEKRDDDGALERILVTLKKPESSLFGSIEEAPERDFLCALRQEVLRLTADGSRETSVELEILSAALEPLTVAGKQVVWFETMRYGASATARMLRMDPKTVEKLRNQGAELLRGHLDQWSANLLSAAGAQLGSDAWNARTPECFPSKAFFDIVDGRITWQRRDQMDRHVVKCWHCVDHFCRCLEVIDLSRDVQPLSEEQASPFNSALGIRTEKPPIWKRVFAR